MWLIDFKYGVQAQDAHIVHKVKDAGYYDRM